ncbi:hypothetical protein [Chondromyces apiculatus]|uniref:Uncharacterized protein n=1 Tax=Chondromyces apiculatus DSM 436 TaxID=1192034 RepID=A0A017TFR9_9BACT|nr:hypothetical protein [Chondromyces apiculatus]EYF07670.1 Hypothetical protein CAP_8171 [Chondromyces apiculatus DSM 436]
MSLRARAAAALLLLAPALAPLPTTSVALAARATPGEPPLLVVDRDDDDGDRIPDGEQQLVPSAPELLSLPVPPRAGAGTASFELPSGLRLLAQGKPLAQGAAIPPATRRLELQALRPGRHELRLSGEPLRVSAVEVRALDGAGRTIDLARSHASFQRTPPDRLADDPLADLADPDALRFLLIGVADDLPTTVHLLSLAPSGEVLDRLPDIPLGHVSCPADAPPPLVCGSTRPIRVVADDIDRNHPVVADRSIKARLGGALVVATSSGLKLQMIRIAGPRISALGPLERYRARLRMLLVRGRPGGPPPIGGTDPEAIALVRGEVERANALWGACGISFGPPETLDARVVDPPRPHLLALGCDHGLPASGGEIRFRVDGREITARTTPGMLPLAAARVVASAVTAAGYVVRVSDNAATAASAHGATDLLIRRQGGALVNIEPPVSGRLSTDRTLTACVGAVDLEDGLQHFGDIDAIAGTVEERALIKAYDDGDPSTIDVFMVPSFAEGGRIGESFIYADGGAIRNTIIEDRAGLRVDRAAFALAHELGHVLLDDPAHPDFYGIDTPTRLMDADAANPSAYGPRRLLVDECVRALRQSGPAAPVPLLTAWPLAPLAPLAPSTARGL